MEKTKVIRDIGLVSTKKEINWAEYLAYKCFVERQGVDTLLLLRFEEGFNAL